MTILNITNFSCLKEAEFEVTPVVAIIGPQGSGKSVTTKLNYFFADILDLHIKAAERGDSFEEFKRTIGKNFRSWFPPSAWGKERFNISYSSGDFYVRILRRTKNNRPTEDLAISFSDWFEDFYRKSLSAFNSIKKRSLDQDLFDQAARGSTDPFDDIWRLRDTLRSRISKELRSDFVNSQTFIPAGRAFFTSIGKMVAGFDNFSNLDPITIRFAKLFLNLRERNASFGGNIFNRRMGDEFRARNNDFTDRLFGGEIVYEPEAEYVKTRDGRKVPFSSLSSGQQELLPMWTLIRYFAEIEEIRKGNKSSQREILYIEEPEAHLFPTAQSAFLGYIFDSLRFNENTRSLILTTHSPYIMGRLNVFLKAGSLSRRKKRNTDINEVVPRDRWILPSQFSAYAIQDGFVTNIVGEDGIIDSSYLDSISDDIVDDFDRLLDIEMKIS